VLRQHPSSGRASPPNVTLAILGLNWSDAVSVDVTLSEPRRCPSGSVVTLIARWARVQPPESLIGVSRPKAWCINERLVSATGPKDVTQSDEVHERCQQARTGSGPSVVRTFELLRQGPFEACGDVDVDGGVVWCGVVWCEGDRT
jgi:hypothetical protein